MRDPESRYEERSGAASPAMGRDCPQVTVIIPVHNEADHLPGCLDSLAAQDYPLSRIEILIVDGMSDDGSRALVKKRIRSHPDPKIRLLDNPDRVPATALNIGVRESRSDYVIRLDGHTRAAPDFVSKSVGYLRSTGAACVGGRIQTVGRGPVGRAIALAMSSPLGVGNAYFRFTQQRRYVDTVAFGAYRRELFDQVGGFDPDLEFAEDNEFNYRVRKSGGKILLCPDIQTEYHCRSSFVEMFRQYMNYGWGRWRLGFRNPRAISMRQTVPLVFFATVATLLVLSTLFSEFRIPLLVLAGGYLLTVLGGSAWIAARNGWGSIAVLPAAVVLMHVAYAAGSLRAIAQVVTARETAQRLLDIGIAAFMLVLLSPLLLLMMLVVFVDSPGNPFYGGRRVGKNGRVFRMWKIRTMVKHADRIGSTIVTTADPRVTRSGRFLRRTRFDELPQLYNLLVGDLTLIGPRGEVPEIVATYTPEQRKILSFKPGLTGPGTLHYLTEQFARIPCEGNAEEFYRKELMDEKLRIDLDYFRERSMASDARIILRTVVEVIRKVWQ